ncbi:amidohydrolase [Emcibacter sp.]|uniref:amidohydrolase n=1 Tax=Emcibacter sp. TaxID=1979954 RepID=UPI002AA6F2D6|nr:amidohydrolase [Emcibacter sp.]
MTIRTLVLGALFLSPFLAGCDKKEESADTVILNATIYTANDSREMATALAVRDGVFVYVGDEKSAAAYIGADTKITTLDGDLILPGLHDNHIHPSGLVEFERCDLESTPMNLSELSAFMADCIERLQPEPGSWLVGEQWSFALGNTPTAEFKTIRQALDAASPDIPITLAGNDGHHGAYNSAGLALAKSKDGEVIGLSKATLQSDFADYRVTIGVDNAGEPDGMVNEQARSLISPYSMLDGDMSTIIELAGQIPARLNSIGITSIREAAYSAALAPVYDKLAEDDELPLRITLAQFYNPLDFADENGAVDWTALSEKAAAVRDHYKSYDRIKADSMKMFMDGVSEGNPLAVPPGLPNAAKLTPYKQPIFTWDEEKGELQLTGYVDPDSPVCQGDKTDAAAFMAKYGFHPDQCIVSRGVLESPRDIELEFIRRFDAEGYALHLHVIGDRAVRTALDGLEQARKANGPARMPHALAHIQFVHPDDIQRIGDLGLYLAYTYAWIVTDPEYDMTVMPFIDEIKDARDLYRDDYYSFTQAYPVRSTKQAGATLVAGSDAPVDTRDPRPFINIQQAVTRAGITGLPYNEKESVSIQDAIDAYTINGARAMSQDDITGSIEVGKKADFILLDRNIIDLAGSNPTQISQTRVRATWFDGDLVYEASE